MSVISINIMYLIAISMDMHNIDMWFDTRKYGREKNFQKTTAGYSMNLAERFT